MPERPFTGVTSESRPASRYLVSEKVRTEIEEEKKSSSAQ